MKFDIFNQRTQILTVPGRWRSQYRNTKREIGDKLDALDVNTCSADDVAKIIGNRSWTDLFCSSCHEYTTSGVSFGEDYPARVCINCLRGSLAALESVTK